ncbi:hypothetical protein CRENBAI_014178 [Crenichthys baileyi]|uniref:Amine oxidase domain-containing protein n=1 Tax=Crenichthys baileyi TaxID=28760 RepID=A0AAV9QY36_9TELE
MAENMDAKIVIIGCGIAGIAAAQRLIESGFTNVRILEATGRSGGRIKSSRLGNAIIEVGAAFIHGPSEKNPVFCLARDYDLLDPKALTPENQAVDVEEYPPLVPNWFTSSGQKVSPETVDPALEMFHELVDNTPQSKTHKKRSWPSVGDFIKSEVRRRTAKRWKNKDKSSRRLLLGAISTMMKEECCSSATHSMEELDLVGFSMYQSIKGVDCTFPSGTESLISSLMSELPADLVSYSRPVRCIHWSNSESGVNAVTVECEDGERIPADHVIVTVSLGYLKKHHSTLFSPVLPDQKLQSIQKIGFGTCDKILVEFESPWWDADCEIIYLVWDDEEDISDHVSDISKTWIRKISSFTVVTPSESECEEPQTCPPGPRTDMEEIRATDIQRPPRTQEPQDNHSRDYRNPPDKNRGESQGNHPAATEQKPRELQQRAHRPRRQPSTPEQIQPWTQRPETLGHITPQAAV